MCQMKLYKQRVGPEGQRIVKERREKIIESASLMIPEHNLTSGPNMLLSIHSLSTNRSLEDP